MNENKENFFIEVLKFSLLTLLIVLPFRMYIAKPFIVSGASMSPTFETGNYLIVDQITYKLEKPERGDVIVFKYPKDETRFFIKRIIGLPMETVKIQDNKIFVKNKKKSNDFTLINDFIKNTTMGNMEFALENDEYFVMGDNRTNSSDSRSWGALQENLIIGRAFIRLLPITKINLFPGKLKK